MTPTLLGRIQTRIVVLATVGLAWTLLVTPLLPRGDVRLGAAYSLTIRALFLVLLLGAVVWEPIYHGLQQFRWEKDWPTGLGLVVGFVEALPVHAILAADGPVPDAAFALHFTSTWIVVWLTVNGPLRIVALRWRYRGGRIL